MSARLSLKTVEPAITTTEIWVSMREIGKGPSAASSNSKDFCCWDMIIAGEVAYDSFTQISPEGHGHLKRRILTGAGRPYSVRQQLKVASGDSVRTVNAGDIAFQVGDDNAGFWGQVSAATWEPATFDAIGRHLTPETTFLDFGAWIGPVTLYAAAKAKRVLSFEPDHEALRQLRDNISLNPALQGKIEVLEKAVWPVAGKLRMGARTAPGDSMSSMMHTNAEVSWEVEAITPASVEALVDPNEPLFIKIDVEGAEYEIVPALGSLLARPKIAVLIAFHPRFAAGGGFRLHRSFPMTRRVFRVFDGWEHYRVRRDSIHRAFRTEFLTRLPIPCFEAKSGYLFVKR